MQFIASDGGKHIDGESKIKDVCADCNSGTLSSLDSYVNTHFTPQCLPLMESGDSRVIEYDFDLLLRWMLKVGFNSGRAYQTDWQLLKPYRGYIMGNGKRPKRAAVYAFGVKPYRVSEAVKASMGGEAGDFLYPDMFRITQLYFDAPHSQITVSRGFVFRSVFIVVLLAPKKMAFRDFNAVISAFRLVYPKAVRLEADRARSTISADSFDAWEVQQAHTSAYPHLYT